MKRYNVSLMGIMLAEDIGAGQAAKLVGTSVQYIYTMSHKGQIKYKGKCGIYDIEPIDDPVEIYATPEFRMWFTDEWNEAREAFALLKSDEGILMMNKRKGKVIRWVQRR